MRIYDFEKAKALINKSASDIESASLGMHEDWFWTAETVFENGEFIKDLTEETEISGINGSVWATPTILLCFKDGSEKMIPVFVGSADDTDF